MRLTDLQISRLTAARQSALRVAAICVSVLAVFSFSSTALAQSTDQKKAVPSSVTLNTGSAGFVGLSPSLSGAMIDLPADAVGSTIFDLDIRNRDCLSGTSTCLRRDTGDKLDMIYNKPLKGVSALGVDLQLTPRASVSFNDDGSSALVGALVRIGDNLREGSNLKSNTWYFFAGADAEAVTYSPHSVSRLTSGNFNLQDRIIVGDAQAGIGYKIGDADVSLGYFRREVSGFSNNDPLDDFSKKEDAAALSFTWRR